MSESDGIGLNKASLARVDQLCDLFEHAWRSGQRPSIDEFLVLADEPESAKLRLELEALRAELQSQSLRGGSNDSSNRTP